MEQKLEERINYYESSACEIAGKLREKGYQIASSIGVRVGEPSPHVLGILEPRELIEKSFLGFKWYGKQRALFIGTLWVDNYVKRVKKDWVLKVYGRNNVPKLIELMRELSEPKKRSVQISLDREQPDLETYDSDFD